MTGPSALLRTSEDESQIGGGMSQHSDTSQGHSPAEQPARPGRGGILRQVRLRFTRDGCSLMAAATAFYGLISLIPLGVLAVSVLGRVLGSAAPGEAEHQVVGLLRGIVPLRAPAVEEAIRRFPHSGSWYVELIGVLGLLWAGSRLFHTLEDVLTRVWSGHGRGRPLFLRNLIALAATAGAGVIFLAAMVATAAGAAVASAQATLGNLPGLGWLERGMRGGVAFAGAWLMFLLMYKFLPQGRVRWREAMVGAAGAAIMWEVCRAVFAMLATHGAAYGRLYGSLTGTVLVSVWIYVSAVIMLVGAELAVVLQAREQAEED